MNHKIYHCHFILHEFFRNFFGLHYPRELIHYIILILFEWKSIQIGANNNFSMIYDKGIYVSGCTISFDDYHNQFHFRKVRELSNIKKIICGNHYLYAIHENNNCYFLMSDIWRSMQPMLTNVKSIIFGQDHHIILTDSDVYAKGHNDYGQLGLGDTIKRYNYYQIDLFDIIYINCGSFFSVAISNSDKMYVWGSNKFGQLGLGDTVNRLSPVVYPIPNVKSVACGKSFMIVLTNDDKIYVSGNGKYGKLGLEFYGTLKNPQLLNLQNIKVISSGLEHSVALSSTGDVYVWGRNLYGQLGLGDTHHRKIPQKLELSNVEFVECGSHHTIVSTVFGVVYTWGRNNEGQLGFGDQLSRYYPTRIKIDEFID